MFARNGVPVSDSPLAEQPPRQLDMFRHADRAIHLDRLVEERSGLLVVSGLIAVEEHPRIPSAHLRLGDLVRDLFRLAQRGLEVRLRRSPLSAAGRGEPRGHLGQPRGEIGDDDAPIFHDLADGRVQPVRFVTLAYHRERLSCQDCEERVAREQCVLLPEEGGVPLTEGVEPGPFATIGLHDVVPARCQLAPRCPGS